MNRKVLFLILVVLVLAAVVVNFTAEPKPEISTCGVDVPRVPFHPLPDLHPIYTVKNTDRGLLGNSIRALQMTTKGLLIGYAGIENPRSLTLLTDKAWETCQGQGTGPAGHVNAIGLGNQGHIFVVTDGNGVYEWRGDEWIQYDSASGLTDSRGYDILFVDELDPIVSTYEGLFSFGNIGWVERPDLMDPTCSPHIHSVFIHPKTGELWLGTIGNGICRLTENGWIKYSALGGPTSIGSNNVRDIELDPSNENIVWIATDGGGISGYNYTTDQWIIEDMPELSAIDIAFDPYGRKWVGTLKGLFYEELDGTWNQWGDKPTLAIVFGCDRCIHDERQMFLGFDGLGLGHDTIPPPITNSGESAVLIAIPSSSQISNLEEEGEK